MVDGECSVRRLAIILVWTLLGILPPMTARAELLAEIRSRGVLKVGMAEMPPWMAMGADGKPEGLEVDMAARLAGDLGVELQVVPIPFEALVDRLAAREVDVVASNLSITPERALMVAFSQPYAASEIRAVVRSDLLPEEVDEEGLNKPEVTIAATAGTTGAQTAVEVFPLAQITEYATHAEARQALLDGKAMALVGSTPYPDLLAAADERLALLGEAPLRIAVEAVAVPQGEQVLLTFLDNWLDAISAEGFIEATRAAWLAPEAASP
jgi:ABC-type amino acid transport substrate-binding protein